MSVIDELENVLHHINVWLYPNYFKTKEGETRGGAYIARTDNGRVLDTDAVLRFMEKRTDFHGNIDEAREYINWYNAEVALQLCSGNAVENGYYRIFSQMTGSINNPHAAHDHDQNPVRFAFSVLSRLRNLSRKTSVKILGVKNTNGYIDQFIDQYENSVNGYFIAGDMFSVHGHKVKIVGNHPDVGFYIVDENGVHTKLLKLGENTRTKITGVMPQTAGAKVRIKIVTQYNGSSSSMLKEPRTIISEFTIERA